MQNLKFTIIILLLLIANCKNKKESSNLVLNKENTKTNKVLLTKNEAFVGDWFFESINNKDSVNNKTFEINLSKTKDNKIEGNYCSVSRNGNKIDCFKDNELNIFGYVKNDTLFINFNSNWENSAGRAILYLTNRNQLFWKITQSKGELYLPNEVVLKKQL